MKGAGCETSMEEPVVVRGKKKLDDAAVRSSSPDMLLLSSGVSVRENIEVSQERKRPAPVSAKRQFPAQRRTTSLGGAAAAGDGIQPSHDHQPPPPSKQQHTLTTQASSKALNPRRNQSSIDFSEYGTPSMISYFKMKRRSLEPNGSIQDCMKNEF